MVKKIDPSSIIASTPTISTSPGGTATYADYEVGSRDSITTALAEAVADIDSRKLKETLGGISAGYMVSVDGNSSPKRIHATIDEAKAEAERISVRQQGKIIRILYLVGVYEPSHTFRELV